MMQNLIVGWVLFTAFWTLPIAFIGLLVGVAHITNNMMWIAGILGFISAAIATKDDE
jgi:succinate-acetate transporter protein